MLIGKHYDGRDPTVAQAMNRRCINLKTLYVSLVFIFQNKFNLS
jgi:hypothetical protein